MFFRPSDTYHKVCTHNVRAEAVNPSSAHLWTKIKNRSLAAKSQSDKKSSPQGGNLVWYMLALGVLLLLMVTMFNSGSGQPLGFSDLLKLVEVSGKDANGKEGVGYIDVADPTTAQPQQRVRIRDYQRHRRRQLERRRQGDATAIVSSRAGAAPSDGKN